MANDPTLAQEGARDRRFVYDQDFEFMAESNLQVLSISNNGGVHGKKAEKQPPN